MTLEQVKQFSETATIEMVRDWSDTVFSGTIGLVFLAATILLIFKIWEERKEGLSVWVVYGLTCIITSTLAFVCILGSITYAEKPAEGEMLNFKAKQTQWIREYVNPYIEQLPVQQEELKQIEYNYILGEKSEKNELESSYQTPIEATTQTGKTITGWAQIEPIEPGEPERIEYVELEEELTFGGDETRGAVNKEKEYRAGYYKIVVYTSGLQ